MIVDAMYFIIAITVATTRVVTIMRDIKSIKTRETILSDAQPHLGYLVVRLDKMHKSKEGL